jgi:hypothetical protein
MAEFGTPWTATWRRTPMPSKLVARCGYPSCREALFEATLADDGSTSGMAESLGFSYDAGLDIWRLNQYSQTRWEHERRNRVSWSAFHQQFRHKPWGRFMVPVQLPARVRCPVCEKVSEVPAIADEGDVPP